MAYTGNNPKHALDMLITENCFINGELAEAGQIINMSGDDAYLLASSGRARIAKPEDKAELARQAAKAAKTDKA